MGALKLDSSMSLWKIRRIPELRKYKKYILYGGGMLYKVMSLASLDTMRKALWNTDVIIEGLKYLHQKDQEGNILYFTYNGSERKGSKKDVNLIHFKAPEHDNKKPYIIVAAGGAFTAVCSLMESYLSAKYFNQLGYDVFVLTYRVSGKGGALPNALEDLCSAVKYVIKNQNAFDVIGDNYIVCGFSAGGTLTAEWGTKTVGYAYYHLPRPLALLPIYSVTSNKYFIEDEEGKNIIDPRQVKWFMKNQFDISEPDQAMLDKYEVIENVTEEYPPCYICCCEDDTTVPPKNSQFLYDKLREKDIPSVLHIFEHGGHGFGCGKDTDAKDWILEADKFIKSLER